LGELAIDRFEEFKYENLSFADPLLWRKLDGRRGRTGVIDGFLRGSNITEDIPRRSIRSRYKSQNPDRQS
jgi:hypothetical protein